MKNEEITTIATTLNIHNENNFEKILLITIMKK
jgi:hypothetical protein